MVPSCRLRIALLALAAGIGSSWPSSPVLAQFPSSVVPGTRVRFTLRDSLRQEPLRPRNQLLIGTVERVAGDSMVVAIPYAAGAVTVSRGDMGYLGVSRGVPSRAESAIRHGLDLAAGLALAFYAIRSTNDGSSFRSEGEAAAVGAGIGFGIGAVLGAISPSERWRRVRLRD